MDNYLKLLAEFNHPENVDKLYDLMDEYIECVEAVNKYKIYTDDISKTRCRKF